MINESLVKPLVTTYEAFMKSALLDIQNLLN